MPIEHMNRRHFLSNSVAGFSALGMGWHWGGTASADGPPQVLARASSVADDHVLRPALHVAEASLKTLDGVTDYVSVFHKKELVGRRMVDSRMSLKFRENPFSVYLKFLEPNSGRQALYVAGNYQDKLLVKDVGFASLVGTISLDPTGSMAMEDNRYPITSIGLRNLVTKLMENWINDAKLSGMVVVITPDVPVGNLKCKLVDVTHKQPHPEARFQATRLYVDQATGHPVRVQAFAHPTRRENLGPLVEDYFYSNLRVNVGLTDMDFSTKNREYRF